MSITVTPPNDKGKAFRDDGVSPHNKRNSIDNAHYQSTLIMARHIVEIIYKVRGHRPSITSSFATIGVDSLGAIIFLKYLSDSLGGLRIEAAMVYVPGVTVKSLAGELLTKMEIEGQKMPSGTALYKCGM